MCTVDAAGRAGTLRICIRQPSCAMLRAVITGTVIQGGAMSFDSRKRNREGVRGAGSTHPSGHDIGRTHAGARWDLSATRASSGRTMPRIGAVLLAIVVVALLTMGLHVLFQ